MRLPAAIPGAAFLVAMTGLVAGFWGCPWAGPMLWAGAAVLMLSALADEWLRNAHRARRRRERQDHAGNGPDRAHGPPVRDGAAE